MAALCRKRNTTVEKCFKAGDLTLDGFVERQADKCLHNRQIRSLEDPEDFYRRVRHFASEKAGGVPLDEIEQAVRTGVIATADHHGSIFCSQSFQGDILFHHLLKMLGYRGTVVPVLSSGQVELENSSYSRGFCVYTSPEKKLFYPLFPAKHSLRMVSQTGLVDAEMLKRFRRRFICQMEDEVTAGALDEICRLVYEPDDVQKAVRFGDQTSLTGLKLTGHLFPENDAPAFCYLEFEELIRPLLMRELSEGTSLLSGLLFDDGLRKNAGKLRLPDGTVLTELMFKCADEKGRKISLTLTEDGFLTGMDWHGEIVSYRADPDNLLRLLEERRLIPGIFTMAALLFFERGVTWMGGIFQAEYLPWWQEGLVRLLSGMGFGSLSEHIGRYDCSGYISGPVFILYAGEGFATPAGPVEIWIKKPDFARIREMLRGTGLWDAHLIGLSEMYFDLVPRSEREENWYRLIAEDLYRRYPDNMV